MQESISFVKYGEPFREHAQLLRQAVATEEPKNILAIERVCEKNFYENHAQTKAERKMSSKILQLIDDATDKIDAVRHNPEKYRERMKESLGEEEFAKLTKPPLDVVHSLVSSQCRILAKAKGQQNLSPPKQAYYETRREALQEVLKIHQRNCAKALGLEKGVEQEIER